MPDNLNPADPAILTSAPPEAPPAEAVRPVEQPPNPEQEHAPEDTPAAEPVLAPEGAEEAPPAPETPPEPPPPPPSKKRWYTVKVQSGREDSIKEAIERRVKIEGLEEYYGQIIIPVEVVTEVRRGKRVKKEHKLYPGYLFAEVEYNDRILYLFRETSGVGDFVGHTVVSGVTRPPTPLKEHEVERMLRKSETVGKGGEPLTPTPVIHKAPKWSIGDRLRVNDGTFATMEGEVKEINPDKGQVKLQVQIFGRPVEVELEFWQVEKV